MICSGTGTGTIQPDLEAERDGPEDGAGEEGGDEEEEDEDGVDDAEGGDKDEEADGNDVEALAVWKIRKKGTKGKRWKTKEDECLVGAWKLVINDSIFGSNQTYGRYWKRDEINSMRRCRMATMQSWL